MNGVLRRNRFRFNRRGFGNRRHRGFNFRCGGRERGLCWRRLRRTKRSLSHIEFPLPLFDRLRFPLQFPHMLVKR